MGSNREKKRTIQAGVNRLLSSPDWNPHTFKTRSQSAEKPASDALDAIRQADTCTAYNSSSDCAECIKARKESGDTTALCDRHIREAMGME